MPTALFNQPFAPNIRLISGLANVVFPEDYVLNCDTSGGAVSLELPQIPLDYWSTQYKLIVNDFTSNSAANNITINAPAGYTINGQASITINVNGASFFVTVGNNTNYLGLFGGLVSGGGPTGLVSLTNAQLLVLVNTNAIVPTQKYQVTDVSNVDFTAGESVIVEGLRSNTESTVRGAGYFLNADYQGVGNYTGTPIPFGTTRGIWYRGLAPLGLVAGDVCIWDNLHFINLTGTWYNGNPLSSPLTDGVNWLLLPKSSINVGYIRVMDDVKYNILTNEVVYRADKLGNEVDLFVTGLINSLRRFQWGRNSVTRNKLRGRSYFDAQNSFCSFNSNICDNGRIIETTQSGSGSFTGNNISGDSFINSQQTLGTVNYNTIFNGGGLVIEASLGLPDFSYNEISDLTASIRVLSGNTTRKVAGSGLSTFTGILDCSDPNVFTPNTLTINANGPYDTHIGIFLLINIADLINSIRNLSTIFPTTLTNAVGTVPTFNVVGVAGAAANEIISNTGAPFTLVGRTDGTDSVTMIKSGNLNQVTLVNVMA